MTNTIPRLPSRQVDTGNTFKGKDAYRKEGYYTRDMLPEPTVSFLCDYGSFVTYLHGSAEKDAKGKSKKTYRAYLYRSGGEQALFYRSGGKAHVEAALADAIAQQREVDAALGRVTLETPVVRDLIKENEG